jgi:response regulator RpfG family c-di-GMP phosphodiesterase
MARSGPIIMIEDDIDDKEMLESVLQEIGVTNRVIHFIEPEDAFEYLVGTQDKPLLIICDINLPKKTGLELKRKIDDDIHLRKKSIPFIFYTTSINQNEIDNAYITMTVQGYFKKPNSVDEIKNTFKLIIDYWTLSKHPNE